MDEVFRTRIAPQEPETAPEQPAEVKGIVDDPSALEVHTNNSSVLENWEIENGKYGLAYLGIKEIGKTFPLNAQFGIIDKYIKEELSLKGYDKTTKNYQEILQTIEKEIGSDRLSAYERLKKLSGYIKVLKRLKDAETKKKLYFS